MRSNSLPVILKGQVKRYKGNGRKLGCPTANINIQTTLPDGIYFGYADLSMYKHHPALIFIGIPVTVGDMERRIEGHLLDIPDSDYYEQLLTLDIRHFHRPNRTFKSVDILMKNIKSDELAARQWFYNNLKLATLVNNVDTL